jgi:hypothetical protein
MRELLSEVSQIGRFRPVTSYLRVGYVCAGILVLSGLGHALVFLVDGGPWEGPVSWRKPIVFGLSFGITLATLTWIVGLLKAPRTVAWAVVGTLSVASVGEVVLISLQKWRGVPSHFNEDTQFDETVFSLMGSLVSLVVAITVIVTVWSFFRLAAPSALALAVRAGLVLMLVAQLVGVQMIAVGGNTFGAHGALKLPHAFTLHAVQVLPLLALALMVAGTVERQALRVVALGTVGYSCLVASTMVQTYRGRAPLDLGAVPVVLALAGLAVLVTCAVVALRALAVRLHGPARPSAPQQLTG